MAPLSDLNSYEPKYRFNFMNFQSGNHDHRSGQIRSIIENYAEFDAALLRSERGELRSSLLEVGKCLRASMSFQA
jgi:hypothetical protein